MSVQAPPVWLADEPEIVAVLHAVLDRFDRQPGTERRNDVLLRAEQVLPSLARADDSADQTWTLVQELARIGVLQLRAQRIGPYDPAWKGAKLAFQPTSEEVLRHWLARVRVEPAMQQWRAAVEHHAAQFSQDISLLLDRRIAIPTRSPDEVVRALLRVGAVKEPATLRQLSAHAFWGDSKVLDDRGELIAALFPTLVVRDRPIVVSVHLPRDSNGLLFIENQDTYTAASAGRLAPTSGLAFVFAAGFRSSAARARNRGGAILHYTGQSDARLTFEFEAGWFQEGAMKMPCWFWGDLDYAGMQILKSLRSLFADLKAWQPGYAPMVQHVRTHGGYRGGEQLDPQFTGCDYADTVLLPVVREFGQMDQEALV
jgi:hypothetical protein